MKRRQKMKVLAFAMFAGIVAATTPKVTAANIEKYVNSVSEDEAQIVMSLNSSSTNIKPGDKFTVTLNLDKIPSTGIGGVSFKLAYDESKVVADSKVGKGGIGNYPDCIPGPVGQALGMGNAAFNTSGGYKTIAVGMSKAGSDSPEFTGEVLSIQFTALDTIQPGTIEMFMVGNSIDEGGSSADNVAGFTASGVKLEGSTYVTDDTTTYYLKTNLDDLKATVEAQSVRFDTEGPIGLDNINRKTVDLGSMLRIDPTGAQGNTVTWKSSKDSVATVDPNGTVTAVGKGECDITATVDGHTATIHIVVSVAPTDVSFNIDQDLNLDVTTNPTIDLKKNVVITPKDASDAVLDWSTTNERVATVDQNGKVTAVGNGQCEIVVKYGELEDRITVKVTTSVASVNFDKNTLVLDVDEKNTEAVGYTLNPTTSQPRQTTVTSNKSEVATAEVDPETKKVTVTAHSYGTAKITLTVDGKTSTLDVKVTVALKSISLDKTDVTVYKGDSDVVTATANPEGSAWESLAASVKTGTGVDTKVDEQTGKVTFTGLERGNSVVSIYANNDQTGEFIKEVNVTVKENRITNLTLKGQEEEFLRGKSQTLETSLAFEEPETTHKTTDGKTIVWSSDHPEIATVDQNGKVTAVKEGTATITAKMPDTAKKITAEYTVEVVEYPLENVVIDDEDVKSLEEGLEIAPGDQIAIPFTVEPENCTDTKEEIEQKVKESMEFDENLADVDVSYDPETGKGTITVTGKADGEGEVTIVTGTEEDEEGNVVENTVTLKLKVVTPQPDNADTSDIPVAATALVMIVSLGGIVITKKVLVK